MKALFSHLLTYLLILQAVDVFSQEYSFCEFEPSIEMLNSNSNLNKRKQIENFDDVQPLVINVFFHLIKDEDGNNATFSPEETDLLVYIAKMNIKLNPFKIFIKYRGFDEILNSDYLILRKSGDNMNDCDSYPYTWELITYAENFPSPETPYYKEDCINIFLVDNMYKNYCIPFGGLATSGGYLWYKYDRFMNDLDAFSEMSLYHEFGHSLGLLHTHHASTSTAGYAENVTRNSDDPCFNADTKGDAVIDTYATKKYPGYDDNCNFVFDTTRKDSCDEPYVNVQIDNIMLYTYAFSCQTVFTEGQGERMRWWINNHLSEVITTTSSLYEPYKIEFYSDNNSGHDNIMLKSGISFAKPVNTPVGYNISYFQPGFDYEIYNCNVINSTGETTIYDIAYIYERSLHNVPFYNQQGHAMRIVQVGDGLGDCHPHWLSPISVIGGSVYSHTQNNVQELDSTNINSADLLHVLPTGINTININTNTGETSQKTIYKPDD